MERHRRDFFFLADRNEVVGSVQRPATASERESAFRFSRIVERTAPPTSEALLRALAAAMVAQAPDVDGDVPAGFTYLAQFVDHDMTRDVTKVPFKTPLAVDQLIQGRSPALDLDSVYGLGPDDPNDAHRYESDGAQLRVGKTQKSVPPGTVAALPLDGFDLPRLGTRATDETKRRMADIPDQRNDENLVVAQTHLAFMRFHNARVKQLALEATPSSRLFEVAREDTVKHYQWMLLNDFLPRIAAEEIVADVLERGRRIFEPDAITVPTMPIEFSVAAYRFGHSMIRAGYDWNEHFNPHGGPNVLAPGTLDNLFRFSGTSGNLSPGTVSDNPVEGTFEQLPTNWIADFTRLYDFAGDAGLGELVPVAPAGLNLARRIDTRLTNPLANLPLGAFDGRGTVVADPLERNLAFRNLVRGQMVGLASAQDVARHFESAGLTPTLLTAEQIIGGVAGGIDLAPLSEALREELTTATPLWFYVLREAEINAGKLGEIGGRIVAETFHRAIEGSRISVLRDPGWQPKGGITAGTFRMTDLLLQAFDASRGELRILSPNAPRPAVV